MQNEKFFRKNAFVKVYLDDKSGDFYWHKDINHPYLTGLNIDVDPNFVTVNAIDHYDGEEVTLYSSRENSIENVKDVLLKFQALCH